MRFHTLKGMPIVSLGDASKLGQVDDLLVDPAVQRAAGLLVRPPGLFSGHKVVVWTDIKFIGKDAVTIADASVLQQRNMVADLEAAENIGPVTGSRMLTEGGEDLGAISDIDIDVTSGEILQYIVGSNLLDRLRGHDYVVPRSAVQRIGKNIVVVSNEFASI